MDLTQEELDFLSNYRLSANDVLDTCYLSQVDAREKAKAFGKELCIGSLCEKAGHRLRTRSGHCVQCYPSKLAYQRRHSQKAYVYIAGSLEKKWIKVGTTSNMLGREETLNKGAGYGGANDWTMLLYFLVESAGKIEKEIQSHLVQFAVNQKYIKLGVEVKASEIFDCPFRKTYEALHKALPSEVTKAMKPEEAYMAREEIIKLYNFL